MTIRPALVVMGVSALLGGCVIKASGFDQWGGKGGGGKGSQSTYVGDECEQVTQKDNEASKTIEDPTIEQRVLGAICNRDYVYNDTYGSSAYFTSNGYGRGHAILVAPLDLEKAHAEFEDRKIDAVTAALFAIQVATNDDRMGTKRDYLHIEELEKDEKDETKGYRSEHVLGLAHLYAAMAKPLLQAQVKTLNLPDDAKTALLEEFGRADANLQEMIAPMAAPKKAIFLDLPEKIHADRIAYYQVHAAEYQKLDALEVQAASARKGSGDANAVAAALTALRGEYVARWGTEASTRDPFYFEATRELVLLYLTAKQPLLAVAEGHVLSRKGAGEHRFAQEIFDAQEHAGVLAREAFELKEKAQGTGLDATTTKAVVGDVAPLDFQSGVFWMPDPLPDYAAVVESKTVQISVGYVQSVKPKGTTATVDFKTEYYTTEEPYNCVKTGRLEAIHDDGTLQWEERCQYTTKKVPRDKPAPVTVLAADAKSLKSGEELTFVVDTSTRGAVVITAFKDEKTLAQLRGDRIDGKKAATKSTEGKKANAKKVEGKAAT